MKKIILAAGLTSLFSSIPAFGQERSSPYPTAVCTEWIKSEHSGEEVKVCNYYANDQLLKDAARFYRNKIHTAEVTKIEKLWDGEVYERFAFFYGANGNPVQMLHYLTDEKREIRLYMRYEFTCDWLTNVIVEEKVYDHRKNILREAKDTNDDGKIDRTIRYEYDGSGKRIKGTLDEDGDGVIDATWDFKKEDWKEVKVYKPKYF